MKTARFEVLSPDEVERIHGASMQVLHEIGLKVDYAPARELFRQAGAEVHASSNIVRIPEDLVRWAVSQAPSQFALYGSDAQFCLPIGGDEVCFAGLGTPTHILDADTGERRSTTLADVVRHIQLIDACENIHNSQMDV